MTDGVASVYLDTNIFQPVLYNSDSRANRGFAQTVCENLRGDVTEDRIDVVIPKPAMGELINNFYRDYEEYGPAEVGSWDDFADEIYWYLNQVEASICEVTADAVTTASELIRRDSRLDGTDAIIAGCALEDPWSDHLVTDDGDFHETNAIQEIDEERQPTPRFNSLNITDNY